MSAVPGNLLPAPKPVSRFGPKQRAILLNPVLLNNPIGVQVLGICSALAVTTSVAKSLVLGVGVMLVGMLASLAVSLVRNHTPFVDPHHRAAGHHRFAGDRLRPGAQGHTVRTVAGAQRVRRPDHHQLHRARPRRRLRDEQPTLGVGTRRPGQRDGLCLGAGDRRLLRELLGAGKVLGYTILPQIKDGGWYDPNGMMLLAPSALFIIGLLIWALRTWKPELQEKA
jgi:Na+-transporting NADH:ubiquinone oxidoreductase subunit D